MKKAKMRGIPDAKLAEILREHENVINSHAVVIRDLVEKVTRLVAAAPADDGA